MELGLQLYLVIFVIAACLVVWLHGKNNVSSQTRSKCSDYFGGLPVWPDSITAFKNDAYGVVIGKILNPEAYSLAWTKSDPAPRLRITNVFKGGALYEGDTLKLCGNTGLIDFAGNNRTVLVFLDGKNQDFWIPLQGDIGIIPQSKDGRFRQEWGDGSKTSATVDELKRLIK